MDRDTERRNVHLEDQERKGWEEKIRLVYENVYCGKGK